MIKEGVSQAEISEILDTSFSNVSKFINSMKKPYRAKKGASNAIINRELAALKRVFNL